MKRITKFLLAGFLALAAVISWAGLESGTYINSLVATNPTAGDPVSQGDDHSRLIKSTVKNSFPNIAGAMNLSHTQLNRLLTYSASGNGYQVLPSGIIMQWGAGNTGVGSSVTVTFPTPCSGAPYSIVISNSTSSTSGITLFAGLGTTTGFTAASSTPSIGFNWQAVCS